MSLRMNLRGWSDSSFTRVLGSKDPAVLDGALARVEESMNEEPARSWAAVWVRTLVEDGFPLREDRRPPAEAADGGLLQVLMEGEFHALAVYHLVQTIARPDHLDLAGESSVWTHAAVGALHRELVGCGLTKSRQCTVQYFTGVSRLSGGSPLFGDEFRSDWSFYSWFGTQELTTLVPTLRAAAEFTRPRPPGPPPAEVSAGGRAFAAALAGWFDRLHVAGQDAFILWW